jgi:hypothetical protein
MLTSIESELMDLVVACDVVSEPPVAGWHVDQWSLSDEALDRLALVYRALIVPIGEEMISELEADGVDTTAIFQDEGVRVDETTRADALELAAAATAVKVEGLDPSRIHMPNVPKASRRYSSRGIDLMGCNLDVTLVGNSLGPDEQIIFYSVKHTVSDVDDLVSKVRSSLGPVILNTSYIFGQLRVLSGRLSELGVVAHRLFSVLPNFHENEQVHLVGVACADKEQEAQLQSALRLLPETTGARRCRKIFVSDISNLHTKLET